MTRTPLPLLLRLAFWLATRSSGANRMNACRWLFMRADPWERRKLWHDFGQVLDVAHDGVIGSADHPPTGRTCPEPRRGEGPR
jgi:hypothetical protein